MRSWIEHILRPCLRLNLIKSGSRAIVPSSFMISQITPEGSRPARRARSIEASVWPARRRTPPALAWSGNTWPGWIKSLDFVWESESKRIVRARSFALIPVLIPCVASTETVKSVLKNSRLVATMRCKSSWEARSSVIGAQINPRPNFAMKFTAFAVTLDAAITKSPSFSRSASSVTMTMRPRRISEITEGIGSNGVFMVKWADPSSCHGL